MTFTMYDNFFLKLIDYVFKTRETKFNSRIFFYFIMPWRLLEKSIFCDSNLLHMFVKMGLT